ncbi:Bug family tripartite tricarboxylate transporter substrate binding protein [Pseudorhodoferax sp.]|uniref:Bug family tripartite tricarboxylate transporter substrate binding protein n=1 Tax=Pseudorhodoferax sp. TaxID=1993553 RepID=UPI0039E361AB
MQTRKTFIGTAAALAALLATGTAAAADAFPSKPVRLVVPFAAGSSSDQWARVLAPMLEARWKQPVIVENKPGASGTIAADYVARAPADGHTMLVGSQSTAMAKLTSASIKFDPQVELAPVYKFISYKIVFATNAPTYAQARTLKDLVAYSQRAQGVFFGGLGPSSSFNVTNAIINRALGMKYSDIDFPGPAQMMLALARNDVQLVVNTPSALKGQIDAKTVFSIGVLSEQRYSDMPDVPTVREAGYQGYLPQIWNGLFTARATPAAVREQIARDVAAVATTPEGRQQFESRFTGEVQQSSPERFERELAEETRHWREFFASIHFKPE